MSTAIGPLVNRLLAPIGLQVRRLREPRYFGELGIQTVLDVGANTGQFARRIRSQLPGAVIHCFEPLPKTLQLLRKASRKDQRIYFHAIALGDSEGEAEMFENAFTPSSSLLAMTQAHVRAFPFSGASRTVRVPVARLDTWAGSHELREPLLIKLDVQGYEDRVLRGGVRTMARACALIVEMSFQELYRDQLLFDGMYTLLRNLGFQCVGFENVLLDPSSGATLQVDAIFLRRSVTTFGAGLP